METITGQLPNDPLIGALVRDKLVYYPTVTREPFRHNGRITALIETGKLFEEFGLPPLDRAAGRVMLCGSPHVLSDLQTVLAERKFNEGNHSEPATS